MPRYFFHVHDGQDSIDQAGLELPDPQTARAEAIRAAGEMLRDLDGALSTGEWRMDVTDESGQPVLTLRFYAEEHTGQPAPLP